jgi:hypothetical protein
MPAATAVGVGCGAYSEPGRVGAKNTRVITSNSPRNPTAARGSGEGHAPVLLAALLGLCACAPNPISHHHNGTAAWQLERSADPHSGTASCALNSAATRFVTGAGVDYVRLVVHRGGLVSIQAEHDSFDLDVRTQMGIEVQGHGALTAPARGASSRELTYSSAESERLLEWFTTSDWARIQIALLPRKEMLTAPYSLEGFEDSLRAYRMCEVFRTVQQSRNDNAPR